MNRNYPLRRIMHFGNVCPIRIAVMAWLLDVLKGDGWYDPAQVHEAVGTKPFTR